MRLRVTGVECNGPLQQFSRGCDVVLLSAVHQRQRTNDAFPGVQTIRWLSPDSNALRGIQLRFNRSDNLLGDLILHGKDVTKLPIESLGPNMTVVRGIKKLCGDPQAVARF